MMAEDGDGGSGSCSECASNTWEYEDHGGQSLQAMLNRNLDLQNLYTFSPLIGVHKLWEMQGSGII